MTEIVYFATEHQVSAESAVRAKLDKYSPDFLTMEYTSEIKPSIFEYIRQRRKMDGPVFAKLEHIDDWLLSILTDDGACLRRSVQGEEKAFIEYAFRRFPVFLTDSYREYFLCAPGPLNHHPDSIHTDLSVFGILPPDGEIVLHNFGLPDVLPQETQELYLETSNFAMAHNIQQLAEKYQPRLIAHVSGRNHYTCPEGSRIQKLVKLRSIGIWDAVKNRELTID